ncbi:MAG: outer membrane protein assembly factor BamB, partial [Trinickia sp.]
MNLLKRFAVPVACAMTVLAMAACSSTKDPRREPVPLTEVKSVFNVEQAWKTSVGKAGRYFFSPVVVGDAVYAAGSGGTVAKIDGKTGQTLWSTSVHADLTSGVGSDGTYTAVGAEKGGVD